MADVYPFIGTRYNSQLIGNLGSVISPPHDMITDAVQKELYERHENNIVRIERALAGDEDDVLANPYSRAANTLGTWRSDGIFIEDERPSFYLYEQVFKNQQGETVSRIGYFAKAKLDENSAVDTDNVSGFAGGKGDRLNLLRSTKANISPVSLLFDDADNVVQEMLRARAKERPWEEVTDKSGTVHRLWVLQKKDLLLKLVELLRDKKLFVVDGYQRYVAAQVYRDEMRRETGKTDGKQPFDFVMALVLPGQQDAVSAMPVHRALTKSIMMDVNLKDALEEIADNFEVEKRKFDVAGGEAEASRLQGLLNNADSDAVSMALLHGSGTAFFLQKKDDADIEDMYDEANLPPCVSGTDACVLHHYIINQVMIGNPEYELEDDECIYSYSAEEVLELIKQKKAVCGFLMKPLSLEQMLEIAGNDAVVPFETSVLHPRPTTGLIMRNMQTDIVKGSRK